MKNIIIIAVAILIASVGHTQERYFDERSVYSMDNIHPVLINPGAIGHNGGHEFLLNYRNAWSSFEGSPKTITFQYNGNIVDRLGAGIGFLRDSYGALNTTKFQLGGSYSLHSMSNKLTMGLTGEYVNHSLDKSVENKNNDPLITNRLEGSSFVDVSFGVQGMYENSLIYGLSLPSLVSARLTKKTTDTTSTSKGFGVIAQLGYKYPFEEYGFSITPMITFKSLMHTPTMTRLNLHGSFLQDKLMGGIAYTIGGENNLGFMLGTKVSDFTLLYSYQASNHDFQTYSNGFHELMLTFAIDAPKATAKSIETMKK